MVQTFGTGWTGFVSFVLSFALPLAVAFVTRESWSGTVKSLVLLVLAAGKTVLTVLATGGHLDVATLTSVAYTFLIAVAGYIVFRGTPLLPALSAFGPISDPTPVLLRPGVRLDAIGGQVDPAVILVPSDPDAPPIQL